MNISKFSCPDQSKRGFQMNKRGLYIGPAGWSYKDWEGIVYPHIEGKDFNHLRFISEIFDAVEINSSFYNPPHASTTQKWISLVTKNPNFLFTYKLWRKFTHDIENSVTVEDEQFVKSGLDVIKESGRLGATLIQLPWSFKNSIKNKSKLAKILESFRDYHPVVEIRHGSWDNTEFYEFLRDNKAGFVNIDQPVIGKSIAFSAIATGDVGYMRLHGRNYQNWFREDQDPASRYDYIYNVTELGEICSRLEDLMTNVPKTFMIFNNHYKGQAIANALQTMFIFTKEKINVPPTMLTFYPELINISRTSNGAQINLF